MCYWSFATINGHLAEIYFDGEGDAIQIEGHCYVKRSEFKLKAEQKAIDKDIVKNRFRYIHGKYIHRV